MGRRVRVSAILAIWAAMVVIVAWVVWHALSAAFAGAWGRPATVAPSTDGWGVVRALLWHLALTVLVFGLGGLVASGVKWAWSGAGSRGQGGPVGELMPAGMGLDWRPPMGLTTLARTAPAPAAVVEPGEAAAFDVDPERVPHVLIVGKTGSGKSTLARYLLGRFCRRYPAEVVVCDPDGVNWLEQTSAGSTEGIAGAVDAVHGEFVRRQAILAEGGQAAWPYLVLLMEETETVFERLGHAGDEIEDRARFELREIARMGRKARVCLWAVTQVAAGDVFDLHVRRNMTVFCALSEPGVGRMLGVPKEVDLTRLAPGAVYASSVGQVLPFPAALSIRLPLSPLYRENGGQPVVQPVATGQNGSLEAVEPVVRLEPGREPTAAQAAEMRALKRRGWSQNRIVFAFWGYKDQVVNDYARAALEGRL